jgi:uncharacterized protein YuzB (UPF0349 family)
MTGETITAEQRARGLYALYATMTNDTRLAIQEQIEQAEQAAELAQFEHDCQALCSFCASSEFLPAVNDPVESEWIHPRPRNRQVLCDAGLLRDEWAAAHAPVTP